jgi:translation elongation factor EF-4
MELCQDKRGNFITMEYLTSQRVMITTNYHYQRFYMIFLIPLNPVPGVMLL